jgi:hypothetical protein
MAVKNNVIIGFMTVPAVFSELDLLANGPSLQNFQHLLQIGKNPGNAAPEIKTDSQNSPPNENLLPCHS